MTKREKALCVLMACLLLVAVLSLTVIPGIRFSGYLALALTGVCVLAIILGRWAEKSRIGKTCKRIFLVGIAAALLLFLTVEGLLLSHGERDNSALPVDAVIVLGAGVNGETPSAALRSRIDAAAAYMDDHGDVPVVLSGGQGSGERISEAECMYRELYREGRVFLLEDQSTSPAENFAYSKALLEEYGVDTENAVIAVVTNDFHIYRSRLIAEREGMTTVGVPAELPWWWLTANYYLREAFALVKTVLFD